MKVQIRKGMLTKKFQKSRMELAAPLVRRGWGVIMDDRLYGGKTRRSLS